ncbi:hypothetical protein KKF91_19835 [Myxococcota bacterium]|nr:hypothetical protein [Myxococcota bacterium]MBU1432796.1 hypothetical protein [Myxococcota bacterium]MBU1897299.1 hypothetical protein [Myxococcota bacterium]
MDVRLLYGLSLFLLAGCDTGFGQPCSLPQTEEFRQACQAGEAQDTEDGGAIQQESLPSCAVKNFAGCETRVCLVYRGSESFCSEPCTSKADCEGSAECRPLIGDVDQSSEEALKALCTDGFTECYCVRASDLS